MMRSQTLSLTFLVLALLSALIYYIDSHLESFYIFSPPLLHDLSRRAIAAHGNDTAAVVDFIVAELSQKGEDGYGKGTEGKSMGRFLNTEEEWVFNNAGGAMGAMRILHASKS